MEQQSSTGACKGWFDGNIERSSIDLSWFFCHPLASSSSEHWKNPNLKAKWLLSSSPQQKYNLYVYEYINLSVLCIFYDNNIAWIKECIKTSQFLDTMFPLDDEGFYSADMSSHYIETWKAMEKLVDEGLVRYIGLSNFNRSQGMYFQVLLLKK